MRFEFATAGRIIFGLGTVREAGTLAAGLGSRALVVTGAGGGRVAQLFDGLGAAGLATATFPVGGEPTVHLVEQAVAQAREFGCDLVVACGGGSVLDAGKAVAALLTNGGELIDYLEAIGAALPLTRPAAPCMAIPTTAGTGAEVTRNAVLGSPEHGVKVSLRSPFLLPRVAIVDSQLTISMPPQVTAATGLDALTQLIEPYVSRRANPLTDTLCRDGVALIARSLRRAYQDGTDAAARDDMALASLYGGLALANSGLGAVHGLAAPIGGMFAAPHGALCGRLLPFVMAANLHGLHAREAESVAVSRYDEVAQLLTGRPHATAADAVEWVGELCSDLSVPSLSSYGIGRDDIPYIVRRAQAATSMQANPLPLTDEELSQVLETAL